MSLDSYEERQILEKRTELAKHEAVRLEALAKVPVAVLRLDSKKQRHPQLVFWGFVTLWISQVMMWAFLMMTFKKDVWPR